jgi:predicted MFS family arabinose efflux permease
MALLSLGEAWVYVGAMLLAFGAGWGWPGLFNFSIVKNNPNAPGAATGITQTGTYAGAVIGPLVFGAIVQASSFTAAWLTAGVFYLLSAIATLVGRTMLLRARAAAVASPP